MIDDIGIGDLRPSEMSLTTKPASQHGSPEMKASSGDTVQ